MLNSIYRFAVSLTLFLCAKVIGDEFEYQLMRNLMRNYDPRVRPSVNASSSLNVTFGLALAQIIDVDEKNQIITTNCWINQAWIDYNLRWNPENYGGLKVIRIPYDAIWRPDILLYNNADVSSYKSSISTNVIVTSDGNVTWLSMTIFRSSCAIDVKYFPFDEQNCTMVFASWTYDGYQVNLVMVGDDGDVSNYIPNSEWTLVKLHAIRNVVYYSCCAEPYPDVTYTIQMKRKPLFYVFNMILPCFLITLVALLGFYIPNDSGEKVSMGITTLLSMTVFLMLVAENMPPTSDVLPLIGLYYGITIAIVSLATAMTVVTLNIHHRGTADEEVPTVVKKVCFGFLARILRLHLPSKHSTDAECSASESCKSWEQQNLISNYVQNAISTIDADYQQSLCFEMSEKTPENGGIPISTGSTETTTSRGRLANRSTANHNSKDGFERQYQRILQKVYQSLEQNEMRLAKQDRKNVIKEEWQQVALVVDRSLFLVFIVTTLAITFGIVIQAPHFYEFLLGPSAYEESFNKTL